MKLEHNLEGITSLIGQIALKHDKGDAFIKADVTKNEIILGGSSDEKVGFFPKKT